MTTELTMPALSPTMEKGTLARWLVREGDIVAAGDLIAEIETDKATMEIEASEAGRIARLIVPEGSEDVPVGTVIALLGNADAPLLASAPAAPAAASAPTSTPAFAPAADLLVLERPVAATTSEDATPLARRIAAMRGIALDAIRGSGARGRIVTADLGLRPLVRAPVTDPVPMPAPLPLVEEPLPAGVPVETVRLSTMRRTIARRLTRSKQTVPHFYLTARCRLDPLLALRAELNAGLAARGVKLSVNDLLLKAMALAMVAVPDVNVRFGGDVLHRFGRVDIAMAVAVEGGLVTPVLRDVASLSLSGIAVQARSLAERAHDTALLPDDYQGGTASLSNLGMFGIDEIVPVLNPPQALILGVGAGIEQPWKVDGAIGLATIIAATASFDHRAIDGAIGARFMAALREHIEAPWLLCC